MDEKQYEENARKIIALVNGMTDSQWAGVEQLINRVFKEKKINVTFETPERLDLLLEQCCII